MALIHSLESSGNKLFKYRGQIPVILFVLAIPVIWFEDLSNYDSNTIMIFRWVAIAISIFGFVFRAIAIGTTPSGTSGRNTSKQVADSLNTTGIYSTVRHPLYVGNYFMWIGIVAYSFNIWFVVAVTLAYWLYYERIMFAEERFLERKFGDSYLDWSKTAPAFIPSFKNYKKNEVPFSLRVILRREYSGILATVLGFVFVDVLRDYFLTLKVEGTTFELNMTYVYVLGAAVLYALIFRSLKHYTKVLNEEGRS